jgi:hypothetical protein
MAVIVTKLKDFINFKSKIKYLIIKNLRRIYKIICLTIMCYQVINVTLKYFTFPYNVNLYLTDDQNLHLPSITICFEFRHNCLFTQKENVFLFKSEAHSRIIPQRIIDCKINLENNKLFDCKQISDINEAIIFSKFLKCFNYFQNQKSNYNLTIINKKINSIEITIKLNELFNKDSCYAHRN